MAKAVKRRLSASDDGKGIKIIQTATVGTSVHEAPLGDTAGSFDEVWLWAQNNHTADVILTVEFGSANTEDNIILTVPPKAGLIPIVPGFILQDQKTIKAFAATANVISIHGFVNRITD